MATTSGNLTAGKAISGQGGGKGHQGGLAALAATAALGLTLLVGGVIGHARQAAAPAVPQAGASANAGVRPVDASTSAAYRWAFGPVRPVDAAVAAEYRWAFGAPPLLPADGPGGYRVSAPNERDPDGTLAGVGAVQRPAGASTAAEYRWAFGEAPVVPPPGASTSTEYRWDFAHYPAR